MMDRPVCVKANKSYPFSLRRISYVVAAGVAFTSALIAPSGLSAGDPTTVSSWVDSVKKGESAYKEEWSVYVRDLESGKVILDYKGNEKLVPASNRKIVSYGLAIEKLGPEFKFKTELGLTKDYGREGGTINATAILRGNGDPSLSPRYLGQKNPASLVREWIQYIKRLGIDRLQGDFIIDASAFGAEQDCHPASWEDNHIQQTYAPLPSAIGLNDNLIKVTVTAGSKGGPGKVVLYPSLGNISIVNETKTSSGSRGFGMRFDDSGRVLTVSGRVDSGKSLSGSIPLRRPLEYVKGIVEDELKSSGITVAGKVRIVTDPNEGRKYIIQNLIAMHESPPLSDLMQVMMRESDNFIAEQVLRATAWRAVGSGDIASVRKLEQGWYTKLNVAWIEPGWDGSGLSRMNMISAADQVAILMAMNRTPYRSFFLDSLPQSGRNGTLRSRTYGASAGRVVAKTGTLSGAGSLGGYIRDKSGRERWAFTFFGNAPRNTGGRLTTRQNQIMTILIGLLDSGGSTGFNGSSIAGTSSTERSESAPPASSRTREKHKRAIPGMKTYVKGRT